MINTSLVSYRVFTKKVEGKKSVDESSGKYGLE